APVGTSRRGGLTLLQRLIVFRPALACRAIRTPEPARPRIHHSAERWALGLPQCARHVPKYYVSAGQSCARNWHSRSPATIGAKNTAKKKIQNDLANEYSPRQSRRNADDIGHITRPPYHPPYLKAG